MTKRFAVLGSPIAHSLSPVIHNAAFAAQELDYQYTRIELADNLEAFLKAEGADFAGFSVTMPLKELALSASSQLDNNAQQAHSVNTLVRQAGRWLGFNTDVLGLRFALNDLTFSSVSILGTGATARSALVALGGKAQIWGRDPEKVKGLCGEFSARGVTLDEALSADLVISTINKGALDPLLDRTSYPGVLFDVVYQDWPSPASLRFSSAISGISLLLHQALYQQRIFVHGDPDKPLNHEPEVFAAMKHALEMAE